MIEVKKSIVCKSVAGIFLLGLLFSCLPQTLLDSASAESAQVISVRRSEFSIPAGLEGRVNFWIDVFGRYGRDKVIVHHRDFPQVVFGVLDFTDEAQTMGDIALSKYKEKIKKSQIAKIEETFRYLATGREAKSPFEAKLVELMSQVPGGKEKYSLAIKEDLIRTQTGIKEKMGDAIARAGRYLPFMERIFNDNGLPIELTRLPFVESSFDYTAYSSVGAAGIWQFMPRTAKLFSLTINQAIDERRDPIRSTMAAAKYLRNAYDELGTWPLAVTSYNHGPYGVKKAVAKMGTTDIATIVEYSGKRVFGFASNNFYAEFLAALEVFKNRRHYFPDVQFEAPLRFEQIELNSATNIGAIRAKLGIDLDELRTYNYAISKRAWEGRINIPRGYVLKVPVGYGTYSSKLSVQERHGTVSASSIYGGITYKVRPGDTLTKIAQKFGIRVQDLVVENNLGASSLRAGQILKISKANEDAEVKPKIKQEVVIKNTDSAVKKTHIVGKGESLWTISKKYSVSVNELKSVNKIAGSGIKAGQRLVIP